MIKYLIAILLTTTAAYSQTIKTLGYNTTNGQIVYSGSNTLTFTNPLGFSNAATTRTNLELGWSALTNTNSINFQKSLFGTNVEIYDSMGIVGISLSEGQTKLLSAISFPYLGGSGQASASRTNLGLGWLALTNTNASNFRTAIGLGTLATNNAVPSGAAASNSILTADGAGSSSFVASKTTYLRSTNIVFSNSIIPTNITGMSWVVSANKTYMVSATAIIDQQVGGYDVRIQWPSALAYTNATNTSGSGVAVIGAGAFTPAWTATTNNLRLFTRGGAALPQQATAFVMVTIGTNGGTANFQVCQQSNNATATTITSLTAIIQEL